MLVDSENDFVEVVKGDKKKFSFMASPKIKQEYSLQDFKPVGMSPDDVLGAVKANRVGVNVHVGKDKKLVFAPLGPDEGNKTIPGGGIK